MPNQCVHCSAFYEDGAVEVLNGCKCGSKFFFYLTEERMKRMQESREESNENLTNAEKEQIEQDVRDIAGIEDDESLIVLDFESVKILKPGKYILDLPNLFSKERPLIYKLEEGKYIIDLSSQLNKFYKG